MRKNRLNGLVKNEKGQTLVIVVLLMLVAALVIAPMLSHVGSGLRTGKDVFENRMYGQYAADSGVEDALYRIQTNDPNMPSEWDGPWVYADAYEAQYIYSIADPVNGNTVDVTIQPHWILDGLEVPPTGMTPHADLVIVGDTVGQEDGNGLYQISINYDQSLGELTIERIGVWLPSVYNYIPYSSNLEEDPSAKYYCEPVVVQHKGGNAIIWDFGSPSPKYEDLPGEGDKRIVTFQFTPQGRPGAAFSWVKAKRNDIYISWDTDLKFYHITSDATDINTGEVITVEACAAENELRDMGTSVAGDYRAIGATLMVDDNNDGFYRDTLLSESDATVSDIPATAHVEAAYLYWSAWLEGDGEVVFYDGCDNFNNWSAGSKWEVYFPAWWNGEFMGNGGGNDGSRTLVLNYEGAGSLDLSDYTGYDVVIISWDQDASYYVDSDEGLYVAFSGDGGSSWSDDILVFLGNNPDSNYSYAIPAAYITDDFQMKFFWDAGSLNEKVYIDDIEIEATEAICDDSVTFEINGTQYYFDGDGDPAAGSGEITANAADQHYLANYTGLGMPNGFSYACKKDVAGLIGLAGVTTGNATYTVGGVDGDTDNEWSYAGWSLIIIYSGAGIDRHQLYLYDDNFIYSGMNCNVDFDGDGEPGGVVSGFLAPEDIIDADYAAHLTCFVGEGDNVYVGDRISVNGTYLSNSASPSTNVWNSASPGLNDDGIDIDTFEVNYPTIMPGDAEASIGLPTGTDSWNLVYIILSFSSEITSGGTISYLIRG